MKKYLVPIVIVLAIAGVWYYFHSQSKKPATKPTPVKPLPNQHEDIPTPIPDSAS